mmetsp:Transcript_37378/g.76707  ORF Transcript_37378/g.76707 Transcript_37378/m.76707 type:complete len:203 (-) Transcript_37378:26-634(-)
MACGTLHRAVNSTGKGAVSHRTRTFARVSIIAAVFVSCLIIGAADAKKKKKTTFKALKCSACKAVADEMRSEIIHEWETRKGDTILVEKRKKKVKIPYPESELSVQEAVDRVCSKEERFSHYNVTSVGGKPGYTKQEKRASNKEFKTQLMNMCQTLIAEHEHEIVEFFFKNRLSGVQEAEKHICSDVGLFCSKEEFGGKDEL